MEPPSHLASAKGSPSGSPTWGTLDPNRPRRRHSNTSGAITFVEQDGDNTPPYVTSPISTRRSSSEAGAVPDDGDLYAVLPPPATLGYNSGESSGGAPVSFLARFQSNIQQLAATDVETIAPVSSGVEAGAALPAVTHSPHHPSASASRDRSPLHHASPSSAMLSPTNARGTTTTTTATRTATTAAAGASSGVTTTPLVGRPMSVHRDGPHSSALHSARDAALPVTASPPASSLNRPPLSTSRAAAHGRGGAAATLTNTMDSPASPLSVIGPSPSRRSFGAPPGAAAAQPSKQPRMNAEVFSESLLPATQFLQHTVRKQEEASAEATFGGQDGGAARLARRSLAASTDSAVTGRPVSAAITMLERGLTDDATALHRQRERNNFYIQKHMQNIEAARESQQELKTFERTLRQMETRNTLSVRRHRMQRKNRRSTGGSAPGTQQQQRRSLALATGGGPDDQRDELGYGDDLDGEDENEEDDEYGDDAEEANRANNRAATDRTLREAAESWAAVQRLQVENPRITRTLQDEVRASNARLAGARTRRPPDGRDFRDGEEDGARTGTAPGASAAASSYPRPHAMDEPAEISWGTAPTTPGNADADATPDRLFSTGGGAGAVGDASPGNVVAVSGARERQESLGTLPLLSLEGTSHVAGETALQLPIASPHQALTRADVVIDDYLGQAGTGLRNLGKPRGDGAPSRSIEEQLQILLEYGNGSSVYQGYGGGGSAAPSSLSTTSRSGAKKRTVKRASSGAIATQPAATTTAAADGCGGVEAGARLPALSPLKEGETTRRRASSSPPIRPPPTSLPEPLHPLDAVSHCEDAASASLPSPVSHQPHNHNTNTAATKRVTFSQPPPTRRTTAAGMSVAGSRGSVTTTVTSESSRTSAPARTGSIQPVDSETASSDPFPAHKTNESDAAAQKGDDGTAAKSRKRFKRATRGREPLPVALGVANRAAAMLQHEILTSRRSNLEMEVTKASNMSRSVKLLSELQPLREELLDRDVINRYQVNPPQMWPTLYDNPDDATTTGFTAGHMALPSGAARAGDALPHAARHAGASGSGGGVVTVRTAGGAEGDQLPVWATPQQVLDSHQRVILGRAVEIDARDRREARLLFVDVLRVMCMERVPAEAQPGVLATLSHARQMLEESSQMQNFSGFKAAVTSHIPSQQLVAWPVQEVLQHLADLFKVPGALYKDWLGNVFVQLGNRHDYEARFRVVDRTIKDRVIPQEANVRLTLHLCRRLPRVLALPNTTGPMAGLLGAVSAGSRLPTLAGSATSEARRAVSPGHPGDSTHSPNNNNNNSKGMSLTMNASTSTTIPTAELAALTSTNPFAQTNLVGSPMGSGTGVAGQHEYAIRMQAERQTVTSSAIPAGNNTSGGGGGGTGTAGGAGGGGLGGHGGSPGRDGSVGASSAGAVGASKRVVNFADQTFKLHLYDTASQIKLTLLQDGQPIADGRFTVQRYGNGRATQLWLPLQVCPDTTLAPGAASGGRNTELNLTVEVLHDKHSAVTSEGGM